MGVEYIYDTVCIVIFFIFSIILVVVTQFCLVQRTCRYWYVHLITSLSFFLAYFSIGLITVDLASSLYYAYLLDKGKDVSYFKDFFQVLFVFWEIIYWVNFILSWGLVPFFKSYVIQGHFVFWRKILGVLWDKLVYYGVCFLLIVCCVVGMILYLVFSDQKNSVFSIVNFSSIFILMTSLSNAFGFVLLVVLLGYGFGSIPSVLFRKSDHKRQLKYLQFRAAETYEDYMDKNDEVNLLLSNLRYLDVKGSSGEAIRRNYVEKMKKNCGKFYTTNIKARKPEDDFSKKKHYVRLNKELIKGIRDVKARQYEFEKIKNAAYLIEDILGSKNGKISRSVNAHKISRLSGGLGNVISRLEWIWYKLMWRCCFMTMCVISCLFPVIFLWCEFTPIIQLFDEKIDLSVISLIMRLMKSQRWMVEIFSFIIIMYLVSIVLYALFKMRLFRHVQFVPRHTASYSMLFACVALTRIFPAFLFNFLTLCGVTEKDQVSYFKVVANVGNFKGLSWLWFGEYFGVVIPIFIPLVILIVWFDVVGRCAKILGVKNRFVVVETLFAKNNPEQMKMGEKILKVEKKKMLSMSPKAIEESMRRKRKNQGGEGDDSSSQEEDELDNMPQVELNRKLSDISSDSDDGKKMFLNSGANRSSML